MKFRDAMLDMRVHTIEIFFKDHMVIMFLLFSFFYLAE